MIESDYDKSRFIELNCGCIIHDISAELSKECIPHRQGNFMQ